MSMKYLSNSNIP